MRCLILLCLFAAVTPTVLRLPKSLNDSLQQWKKVVEPHITECLCQGNAKQEHLLDFYDNGIISDDPCFKCAAKCLGMKLKCFKSDGTIDVTYADQVFPGGAALIQDCSSTTTDLCQKTYEYLVCIYKVVITHLNQSVDNSTVTH